MNNRSSVNRLCLLGLMVLSAAINAGCQRNAPDRGLVHGVVTLDGRPVAKGLIRFIPENGRPAFGKLMADGSYTLTTIDPDDGALVGPHRVVIDAKQFDDDGLPKSFEEEVEMFKSGRTPKGKGKVVWLLPQRYARPETSDLTAQVQLGENRIDFKLRAE